MKIKEFRKNLKENTGGYEVFFEKEFVYFVLFVAVLVFLMFVS